MSSYSVAEGERVRSREEVFAYYATEPWKQVSNWGGGNWEKGENDCMTDPNSLIKNITRGRDLPNKPKGQKREESRRLILIPQPFIDPVWNRFSRRQRGGILWQAETSLGRSTFD